MNRFILVTNRQKLVLFMLGIIFILLSAFFISTLDFSKAIETDSSMANTVLSPENENTQMKNILSTILPSDNKILFENSRRAVDDKYNSSNLPNSSPSEIIENGKNLAYIFAYSDENYLRPIYTSTWKKEYYQGWLYLPKKIISARHCLFAYTGGPSEIYHMDGELGFAPNVSIDNQNYLNLLIYNYDLQNVIQLGNQIVISGTPIKKGVQIISIKKSDITVQTNEKEIISVQLCTPSGYEIDYQNIKLAGLSENNNYGAVQEQANYALDINKKDISEQNVFFRQELTHYISDSSKSIYFQYNGGYQTSYLLNTNIDLDETIKFSNNINYNILYNNPKYQSPVFHPKWKEHYDKEWCYIPRKMYINMKKLFILPSDKDMAYDLCGELGFFEKYDAIDKNQIGLLVNNFSVSNISMLEDNILVSGSPSRTGIQIISIEKTNLTMYKEYAVRLVTKDLCELDIDITGVD